MANELTAPVAHPEFLKASAAVDVMGAKADAARAEADALRSRYKIKQADPRRAAALREIGRDAEADAHESLADLDATAAVYGEAVARAAKDRDAVKARLSHDLSAAAYMTHFLPAAKEAAAAYFTLAAAFDRVREARKEIDSFGLSSPKLVRAADTFGGTSPPTTTKPGVSEIDSFRRLLLAWVDADILDLDEARGAFPADTRFI